LEEIEEIGEEQLGIRARTEEVARKTTQGVSVFCLIFMPRFIACLASYLEEATQQAGPWPNQPIHKVQY
jgi:hypothetical protein